MTLVKPLRIVMVISLTFDILYTVECLVFMGHETFTFVFHRFHILSVLTYLFV